MAKCCFCDEDKKFSKEHIWSDTLLRLFDPIAPLTIDEHRGIAHGGDPVVKDLCRDCNSKMSPSDTSMRAFAEHYLTRSLTETEQIEFSDPNVLRWAMKTVSNHERSLGTGSTWWREYVDFFRGGQGDTGRVDLLLAPWEDLSPGRIAVEMFAMQTLGARELVFAGLRQCDVRAATRHAETLWALKVNSGVFALVVWKPDTPVGVRAPVVSELRDFGWLLWGRDETVKRVPFNEITCLHYHIPSDPDDRDPMELWRRNASAN